MQDYYSESTVSTNYQFEQEVRLLASKVSAFHLNEIVTVSEAAAYLKVDRRSVYNYIKRKQLIAFHIGSCLRLKKSDVVEFSNKNYPQQSIFQTAN